MPLMIPVNAPRLRPDGSAPEDTDQVYNGLPRTAFKVALYGLPATPGFSFVVRIPTGL